MLLLTRSQQNLNIATLGQVTIAKTSKTSLTFYTDDIDMSLVMHCMQL